MSSEEGEPLNNREKRYQKRIHRKFDYKNDKEDKGKTPISRGEDEEKEFLRSFLETCKTFLERSKR